MYATGTDSSFYQAYAQSGIKQTPWTRLALEVAGQGLSTLQAVASHPELVEQGISESVGEWIDRPYATTLGWFNHSGNTLGETAASFTASAQLGINALYGQDVSAQVQTLQTLSSALVASQVTGIGNLAGGATRAAAGMLERTGAKAPVAKEVAVANSDQAPGAGGRQPLSGPTANWQNYLQAEAEIVPNNAVADAEAVQTASSPGKALQTYRPPNGGFWSAPTVETLQPGYQFSRYGGFFDGSGTFQDLGAYGAPADVPYGIRALAPGSDMKPLSVYEAVEPIPGVQSGKASPWFGELGLGQQHQFPMTIQDYLDQGYIKLISRDVPQPH